VISPLRRFPDNQHVWRPFALEEDMLEWKPRLIVLMVLLVALAALLGQFGWGPLQFGW
jgi:hypothetical protein